MIVHLADYAAVYTGNFIPSLFELSKKCIEELNEKTLIIFPSGAKNRDYIEQLINSGIYVGFINMNDSKKIKLLNLKNIIDYYDDMPRLIHTHFARFEMLAIDLKKEYNCKLIQHKHMGFTRESFKHKLYDLYKVKYLGNKYVDLVISVSKHVEDIQVFSGYRNDKIKVVYNGIYIDKHRISKSQRKMMRKKYNIRNDENVAVLFGYDVNTKGTDIVFDSIKYLDDNIKIVFVGREKMKAYLINQNEFERFKDRIIIIDHSENVSEIFNMADIFISASRVEVFSYSVGEAMLYNLPVVISDIKGVSFYKNAGDNVYVFKNEDSRDLAKYINYICENNKFNAEKNRDFVIENLNLDIWINKIVDIYRQLLV